MSEKASEQVSEKVSDKMSRKASANELAANLSSKVPTSEAAQRNDSLQGNLRDVPLRKLLQTIADEKRTGVLNLEGRCEIWFSEGKIYLASNASSPAISEVVFGADAGSLASIQASFAASDAEGSVIAKVLESYPDSEPVLRRLIHEHNLNCLFEVLVPAELDYHFEADRIHGLGDTFAVETSELLTQATRRVEIWRRIASRIPSTSAIFELSPTLPEELGERQVSADEWRYLAQMNGKNTVADVITETGESAFRVCSVLYRLLLEGLLLEATEAEADAASDAEGSRT